MVDCIDITFDLGLSISLQSGFGRAGAILNSS